jgi:CheY-like chemotaxis protein
MYVFYLDIYIYTSFKATNGSTVPHTPRTPRIPLCILVVDDSTANRKMLIRMLKICGHTSTEAVDGLEAVKEIALMMRKRKLRKELDRKESCVYTQYDVVLMDSCMPKMDGPQAAIQMREMGFMGPIIGITGNPVSDFSEFQSAGADLVLSKPISKADLVAALEPTYLMKHVCEEDRIADVDL